MDNSSLPTIFEAKIKGIRFCLATRQEICKASISDCPIGHASQLSNPFLGLPLETGKCESCGTGEAGQCEGHFGYIELPTPIYHPDHVGELKRMLSLLCLKCLKFRNRKSQVKNVTVAERMLSCCEDASLISINEAKTTDGAYYLELKVPPRSNIRQGFWNFLEKYGFRYGDMYSRVRPLLASEVMVILRRIPSGTRKKLVGKGYFPQDGYILQHLPVPPNCLSVPDVSDGISTMSTDYSIALLKKVLRQVEIIKNSRSGVPNFDSHEIEANDLQAAVAQYLQFRGTGKASRDVDSRFGVNKEINASSTKAWLEKMKTLFIRKGSGFSSRSVITGDPFKGVSEIGLPFEVAQKITFEERVNQHNMQFLQKLVDDKLCLTYRDGMSTYSLREGSKGHTFLRPGQVVHRRIMDGDIVFINRPPTTHKHSLQALSVYIHDDHTVKINPLICGPLSADFDGDCIHLFYPQSLEAKAEVVELFSVDKQLLSSHTGNFNLQLATDSLLSLKILFRNYFLDRAAAQQLSMHVPNVLPGPAVVKSNIGPLWTAPQILQTTLPLSFDYSGDNLKIAKSEVLFLDYNREVMAAIVNDIVTSLFFLKGPKEVLRFFNSTQPLLMESLYSKGFSVSLEDLFLTRDVLENIQQNIQNIYPLLCHLRASYSESIALQVDSYLRSVKIPVTNFIVKSSAIGHLIDSKSESALSKVVQQIGFLGIQISDKGKFYSEMLVKDMSSLFQKKYPSYREYPTEEFGLVGRPLFRGLDPYQEMVHSISSREVIVRSSRGLTEPGTLFKNLMAILRDVVICHDGTVRNMCSNSIVQFEYGVSGANIASEFCAGDPVGVLAATAMSNPAYKAVLDSSPSSNSSWEMMKEILLSGVSFKNVTADRRVILYLNNCDCGRKHCQESAAFIVKNHLKKVSLKDTATEFLIEYRSQMVHKNPDVSPSLVGHIHLNKTQLVQSNISMPDILEKCQDTINCNQKKKAGNLFKRIDLSFSECCSFYGSSKSKSIDVPCVQFLWQGPSNELLERTSHILADTVCPVLLQTIIKGDPRVSTANIIWMTPETATWIRSPCKSPKGELALDITLEKEAVKQSGDAWRVVMDSCLPVIHLIDVQRSIPYAIKQVEDLLGISCAFDQAVQRLSTSVTMVTKGVLKDHLLLLGNSMTCAGTLIGFNAGGIKALSRSFGVQVPFMNATLFTPRKCFERAAEKCHVDNLSNIVGSCAWGKHVSVGTGSPFEILWDTRKAELTPDKEIDVYNFLYLVSGSSLRGDMDTGCLGTEIEDLDQQDEYMDYDLSPAREDGMDKPTFEDGIEFGLHGNDNDGLPNEDANDSWSSWGKKVDAEENDWGKKAEQSSWSKKVDSEQNDGARNDGQSPWSTKVDFEESDWGKKVEKNFLGKKVDSEQNDWTMKDGQSSWSKKVDSEENDWDKKAEQSSWSIKVDSEQNDWTVKDGPSSWSKNVDSEGNDGAKTTEQSSWSKKVASEENDVAKDAEENTWTKKFHSDDNHWMKKADHGTWDKKVDTKVNDWMQKSEQNTWSRKVNSEESDWMKKPEQSMWGEKVDSKKDDWTKHGERSSSVEEAKINSSWGTDSDGGGWAKKDNENKWSAMSSSTKPRGKSTWALASGGKDGVENNDNSSWGNVSTPRTITQSSWGGVSTQNDSWGNASTPGNDTQSTCGGTKTVKDVFSGKPQQDGLLSSPSRSQWETPKYEPSKTPVWHTSGSAGDSKDNPWEAKVADQATESNPTNTWGSSNDWSKFDSESPAADNSWGSTQKQSTDSPAAQGWGSLKVDTSSESDGRPQWGRGRGRGQGRGRGRVGRSWEDSQGRGPSSDGDWKNRRPRPVDDPNAPAVFTITRQRLDLFTAEEQDVLLEIELIMKDIRRVMHQTGYNDGDPLSADDQICITEKVFNYHPDKASKMGSGLAHIMVNRHKEFQESRCFYAVSVDGGETDFSYRKCLENFVRTKYPEKAESFIPKYFKKPQPRPNWNRDRCPPRSEAGTPRRTGDTPGPDGAGTPLWNKSEAVTPRWTCDTPGPDDATTPSWSKSEAGTSHWGTDQTPGPDNSTTGWNKNEGGASGWNADQTPGTDDTGTIWGKSESQGPDGASMDWSKSETPGRNDAGTGWEKS